MLKIESVAAAYGPVTALRGIDLAVASGELVCLIGANGAGKSSTLRAISGLLRPSAGLAGLAGSLYAHYTRFVSPEVFLFTYTVTMVIMVVAGGKGTLAGPLVGAVLFTVLPEALRAVTSWQWQMLAYGLILVVLVFFLPRGIVPTFFR